jgi:hypothetical protein
MGYAIQSMSKTSIQEMLNDPRANMFAMQKSLAAGSGTDASAYTGGRAITHESLEDRIMLMLPQLEEATLYRMLPKRSIYATVDQWVTETSYGSPWGHAVGEGLYPNEGTPTLNRMYATVSIYETLCVATNVLLASDNIASPETIMEQAGITNQIQGIDRDMYINDGATLPRRVKGLLGFACDGTSGVYNLDAGGQYLTTKAPIYGIATNMRTRGAKMTNILTHPTMQADFAVLYEKNERIFMLETPAKPNWYVGAQIGGVMTPVGPIEWDGDIFNDIRMSQAPSVPVASPGTVAPSNPTITSAIASGSGGNIPAGTYFYGVAAVYENGTSATVYSSPVTVSEGEIVTLTLAPNDAIATGYYIYRSAINASNDSDCRFLWQAPLNASATFVDNGFWVPGCTDLVMADMRPEQYTMQWSQLIPTTKVQTALLGDLQPRFVIACAAAFRVAKPKYVAVLRNLLPRNTATGENGLPAWNPLGVTLGS